MCQKCPSAQAATQFQWCELPISQQFTAQGVTFVEGADWRGLADPVFVGAAPGRTSSVTGDERYTFGSNLTVNRHAVLICADCHLKHAKRIYLHPFPTRCSPRPRAHHTAMWRVASGPSPGPCLPECLCWSEDNRLAFACDDVLRVVAGGERAVTFKLHADRVLSANKKTVAKTDPMFLPNMNSEQFVALSYSPLAVCPSLGAYLCAAVQHVCTVYAPPHQPLQVLLQPVVQLAPLLHAALGHANPPSEMELDAVHVHRSCWSPMLPWASPTADGIYNPPPPTYKTVDVLLPRGAKAGHAFKEKTQYGEITVTVPPYINEEHAKGNILMTVPVPVPQQLDATVAARRTSASAAKGQCTFLTLAGPSLLVVVAHTPSAQPASARWQLAIRLHPPRGGATSVQFAPRRAPDDASAPLELLSGTVFGSVMFWRLVPQADATSPRLACTASWRIGAPATLTRRVASLSVARLPPAADGTSPGLMLLVGAGAFVMLYRIDADEVEPNGAGEAGNERGPPAGARTIGKLQTQAAHAHDVTSVLCLDGRWYSTSHDGSFLHGALVPGSTSAKRKAADPGEILEAEIADDMDDDEDGEEEELEVELVENEDDEGGEKIPKWKLPFKPQPPPDGPMPLEYPWLDILIEDEEEAQKKMYEVGLAPRVTPTDRRKLFGNSTKKGATSAMGADGEEEAQALAATAIRRHIFGLAAAPCGGALAVCLRASWEDGRDTSRAMVRPDNWRLLLAVPVEAVYGHAKLVVNGAAGVDDAVCGTNRPLGCTVWPLGELMVNSVPPDEQLFTLRRLEQRAASELPPVMPDGDGAAALGFAAVRAQQYVRALAMACHTERFWQQTPDESDWATPLNADDPVDETKELEPWQVDDAARPQAKGGGGCFGPKFTSAEPTEEEIAAEKAEKAEKGAAAAVKKQHLDALEEIAERRARVLLHAQAVSLLAAAACGESDGVKDALSAADWLLATALNEASAPREEGAAYPPPKLGAAERQALALCFREAGCDTSLDALAALDCDGDGDVAMAPELPKREKCLICEGAFGVLDDACEQGHEVGSFTHNRCWVCFKPHHPARSWHCDTCGAGVCATHDTKPVGILCDHSPLGLCGLCGSALMMPSRKMLGFNC